MTLGPTIVAFIKRQISAWRRQRYRAYHRDNCRPWQTALSFAGIWLCLSPLQAEQSETAPSKFRDPSDGAFDVSGFLDTAAGFIPIVNPITEPAVGYGAFGALLFIDKAEADESNGFNRPNIDVVGGGATENGTHGFGAGDIRHWLNDRLKTTVVYFDASINLDYYGTGDIPELEDDPINYTNKPSGFTLGGEYRLGAKSRFWAGIKYTYSESDIAINSAGNLPPEKLPDARTLVNASVTPTFKYDSRDSSFTPTEGIYFSLEPVFYNEAFGSDRNYEIVDVNAIYYTPIAEKLFLGVLASAEASFGEVPFYQLPGLSLRGVPSNRYQGEDIAELETELRWQFSNRHSVLGFVGIGGTWSNNNDESTSDSVLSGGFGWRYELARRYRIHGGIDVGFGPDSSAFYFVVGNAWNRP